MVKTCVRTLEYKSVSQSRLQAKTIMYEQRPFLYDPCHFPIWSASMLVQAVGVKLKID